MPVAKIQRRRQNVTTVVVVVVIIKTTTTTTTANSNGEESALLTGASVSDQPLIYPPRLSDNQRRLADRYLDMIAPDDRQRVLDELQGRLESEQKGMKPVYDELRFLHALCKAAEKVSLCPISGSEWLKDESRGLSRPPPPLDPQQEAIDAEKRERARAHGLEQLAKLRQSFASRTMHSRDAQARSCAFSDDYVSTALRGYSVTSSHPRLTKPPLSL